MSDKAKVEKHEEETISQGSGFWQKNSKIIIGAAVVVIASIGGK
jgi:hypothetical protein